MDQLNLIGFVDAYEPLIASGAASYLAGLGDYTDGTGVKHIMMPIKPNNQGHFGRATALTHSQYEHYPAPAVALERVVQDVHATRDRDYQENLIWDVNAITPIAVAAAVALEEPAQAEARNNRRNARVAAEEGAEPRVEGDAEDEEEMRPEELANPPNANLLGWRASKPMTKNQGERILEVITQDIDNYLELPTTNQTFRLVRGIFEAVNMQLKEQQLYKMSKIPTGTDGSIAQQAVWIMNDEFSFNRQQQFVDNSGRVSSRTMLPTRLAVASKVMCYRALLREIEINGMAHNPWACYTFDRFQDVPNHWRANRNVRVTRGFEGLVAYAPFQTAEAERRAAVSAFFDKFKA